MVLLMMMLMSLTMMMMMMMMMMDKGVFQVGIRASTYVCVRIHIKYTHSCSCVHNYVSVYVHACKLHANIPTKQIVYGTSVLTHYPCVTYDFFFAQYHRKLTLLSSKQGHQQEKTNTNCTKIARSTLHMLQETREL